MSLFLAVHFAHFDDAKALKAKPYAAGYMITWRLDQLGQAREFFGLALYTSVTITTCFKTIQDWAKVVYVAVIDMFPPLLGKEKLTI